MGKDRKDLFIFEANARQRLMKDVWIFYIWALQMCLISIFVSHTMNCRYTFSGNLSVLKAVLAQIKFSAKNTETHFGNKTLWQKRLLTFRETCSLWAATHIQPISHAAESRRLDPDAHARARAWASLHTECRELMACILHSPTNSTWQADNP